MTAVAHPDITCTKCDSVVPWGPHCPQCRAYLEFSGVPAWRPEGEIPAPDPEGTSEEPEAADAPGTTVESEQATDEAQHGDTTLDVDHGADVHEDASAEAHAHAESGADHGDTESEHSHDGGDADAESSPHDDDSGMTVAGRHAAPVGVKRRERSAEARSFTLWQRGWRRQKRRNLVASVVAIALAVGLAFLFVAINGSLNALAAAPFLAVWAFLAVAFYGTIPDQREYEAAERLRPRPEPMAVVEVVDEVVVEDVPEPEDDGIRSREPQMVAETIEKSKPLLEQDATNRDLPCDSCGHLNLRGHRYCEACTAVLGDSRVSPAVLAYTAMDDEGSGAGGNGKSGGKSETQRRINGSWRNVVFVLTILGVIVGAFAFAFFGPGAFRMQLGMTRVYQIVNQWIDPYAGRPAAVSSVMASSSLPGTTPDSLMDADSRTFWASDVLPEFGNGSVVTFTFDDPTEVDRMVIYPGVQNQLFDRRALATPRDITLTFDNGTEVKRTLNSLVSSSDFRQLVGFPRITTTTVELKINSVYPPSETDPSRMGEVAISGAQFLTVPAPPAIFGFQNGTRASRLSGGSGN